MQNKISISVIIPVYQDKDGLINTVNSLVVQNYPKDQYEIIIADNNSQDGTKQTAMELRDTQPNLIRVVHQDQVQSSYAARNTGLKAAKGDICCFIDADMIAPADYLANVSSHFDKDEELMYFGCNVRVLKKASTLSARMNRKDGFKMKEYFKKSNFIGTGCLSVRREIFERIGYFDDRLESGGDKEFGQRVHAAGFKQHYNHALVLYHPSRSTYASMIKKYKRIARGHAQLTHYYPEKYSYYKSDRYYNIFRYIPPLLLKLLAIPFTLIVSTWKYLYYLPIRFCALVEFRKESQKLARKKNKDKKGVT